MLAGFVLAIASGLIVNLVTGYIQARRKPDTILEITRRSQLIISRTTFENGSIIQETTETRIEESVFKLPPAPSKWTEKRLPFLAGFMVFLVIVIILLIA